MSNEKDDSEKLVEFLEHLELKMDFFVHKWAPEFRKRRNNKDVEKIHIMFEAWDETIPQFDELREKLASSDFISKLKSVGLTGKSLDFKLSLVDEAIEDLQKVESLSYDEEYISKRTSRLGILKKLKKPWQKYLEHADTIIGSMGAAGLPGADAIGEFKTGLEKILDWWGKR